MYYVDSLRTLNMGGYANYLMTINQFINQDIRVKLVCLSDTSFRGELRVEYLEVYKERIDNVKIKRQMIQTPTGAKFTMELQ